MVICVHNTIVHINTFIFNLFLPSIYVPLQLSLPKSIFARTIKHKFEMFLYIAIDFDCEFNDKQEVWKDIWKLSLVKWIFHVQMNLWSELFLSLYRTYIRGQNVYMDPVTKKELEDKRLRQLEHQVHHCCSSFVWHSRSISLV